MRRRSFLKMMLAGVLSLAAGLRYRLAAAPEPQVFRHGIASGDPLADRVILWTRVTTESRGPVVVGWNIAEDEGMTRIVAAGSTRTDASRDFTVKVDAAGLPAGRLLYYRFEIGNVQSPVGRTRTLPRSDAKLIKLAVVSCSNYPAGFFNVYREIAARSDLDALLHLGDYIYESGMGGYATEDAEALGRIPEPVTELYSLRDYRKRHAQYKRDPDSQAMLARLPLIAVWDDHELANDCWRSGAQGHRREDGKWSGRRDAAIQAYYEWMPVRGKPRGANTRIFREFRFGKLASLIMLDTRVYGRDRQPDAGRNVTEASVHAALVDPKRRMLGQRQERWLRRRLAQASDTTWQVIAQQVLVAQLTSPDLEPLVDTQKPSTISRRRQQRIIESSKHKRPAGLDMWDGYPIARQDLYADLQRHASNAVLLSGDFHTVLAADLVPEGADEPIAVELMTGSVTSPGMSDALPERTPNALRDGVLRENPTLKYLDTYHRGWLCLTLTDAECRGEWHLVDTVKSREYRSWLDRTLAVRSGEINKGLQA